MHILLLTTEKMLRNAKYMQPYHNVLSLSGPNDFTSNIKMSKTNVSTLANWFNN